MARHRSSMTVRTLTDVGVVMATCAVLVTIVLFLSPLGDALSGTSSVTVVNPQDTVSSADPNTVAQLELTDQERAAALKLVADDSRLAALLRDKSWSIRNTGLWTTADPAERLGAAVELTWSTPASIDATWPVYVENAGGYAYESVDARVIADNVTGVRVMVDLRTSTVAKIVPVEGAENERIVLPAGVTGAAHGNAGGDR
jgi:hypothetical protein